MKIICETSVLNRVHQVNTKTRFSKSTLVLASHPPNRENSELFLILFTPLNKTGQRYKLKDNIKRIFTKCIAEGKITLSLTMPEHDIFVKSEPVQLKCFLKMLGLGLVGKHKTEKIGLSSISSTAIPVSMHPKTKMVITSRGDFPVKGLPRTLTYLKISGLQRYRFDSQILFLKNLTTLDFSENCLTKLPKSVGDLNLREIVLANNNLGDTTEGCAWEWLDGNVMRRTLTTLDLSGNNMTTFPSNILNLKNLVTLKLDRNQITRIPLAIDRINKLKFFHISHNNLTTVPARMGRRCYDTLDISANNFIHVYEIPNFEAARPRSIELWKLAANVIAQNNIPYLPETLPKNLFYILDRTPQCLCGQYCINGVIIEKQYFINLSANTLIKDTGDILADDIVCEKCFIPRRVKVSIGG